MDKVDVKEYEVIREFRCLFSELYINRSLALIIMHSNAS